MADCGVEVDLDDVSLLEHGHSTTSVSTLRPQSNSVDWKEPAYSENSSSMETYGASP